MDKVVLAQFNLQPRSDAELKAAVSRFEAKWQRRRKAHPVIGFVL